MESFSNDKIEVIYSPSKADLREIKEWLIKEKKESKSGFYCNWNIIKDLYSKKHFSCIKVENKVIGFLTWFMDITDPVIKIAITEIMPECRSKGYGKLLVNNSLKYFSSFGVQAVELDCSPETSKPIWMKLGFKVFPDGFYKDSEFRLYKILSNSLKNIKVGNDREIIELWDCEPYMAANEPKWTWEITYGANEGILTKQIINPAHYDWRIRWRKGDIIFRDDKVKYFLRDRSRCIYHYDFIIISELYESDKN